MSQQNTPTRRRGRPASKSTGSESGGVQSLARALTLMELVSEYDQGIPLSDLSAQAALAPSTTHRLLKSLEQMGYLRQDEERSLWFIGVKAFTVGSAFARGRDITAIARPIMRRLMEEVGESVNLAIMEGDEPVYLAQVECHHLMRAHALPGGRAPLHCSGVGKALLAFMSPEQRQQLLQDYDYFTVTEKTITNARDFNQELDRIAADGYAVDDEENSLGMRCIAAVIFNEFDDPIAAVSMTGPSARISSETVAGFSAKVKEAARQITREYGGHIRESEPGQR